MNTANAQARMSRWQAAARHLAVSAVAGTLVVAAMLYIWYPGPFFTAMGGNDVALMTIGMAVAAGPLITLVVFGQSKRLVLLQMDLAIIGVLQAAAVAYGIHLVAESRPVYLVYAFDRFDVVAANDVRDEELARVTLAEYRALPWGRPMTVAVRKPRDPNEQLRVMMSAMAGADLQTFPQHYVPYELEADKAAKRSKPLGDLRRRHPQRAAHIDDEIAALGRREADTRFLPLRARVRDYAVLIDAKNGAIVGYLDVDPW